MCGIGGVLRVWPAGAAVPAPEVSIPESWLDTIDEGIKHRGPDGHGRFRDRAVRADGATVDVAFVHRRLAIIDVADGQQPMVSERGRHDGEGLVAVVFNGCIYNHRELRKELEAAGHRFVTDHSDTEVLVHGWREWGLGISKLAHTNIRSGGLCTRLEGMFAAAMWDRAAATLSLLRDPAGEKPLYYHQLEGGAWAFASTAQSVERLRFRDRGMYDTDSVYGWLHLGFDPVDELGVPPGCSDVLPVDSETMYPRLTPYDRVGAEAEDWELGSPAWTRATPLGVRSAEALLARAVDRRLDADVPLGCFLSGGIDSGLVAAFARQSLGKLSTFTMRMPDPGCDESAAARETARHIGTEHHTLDCKGSPATDLVYLITQLGFPLGDSSLLPTYWISRAARQHVRVVLTGDGGDELFGGYERHMAAPALARTSWLLRLLPSRLLDSSEPKSPRAKLARLARAARGNGYTDLVGIFQGADLWRLARHPGHWSAPWLKVWMSRDSVISAAMNWDTDYYLPGDLMRKVDTATMAVALEARAPFLDRELYAAARSATIASLLPDGERKGLLKAVARKYLPESIVNRPKQGFAIPIGEWFRSDYGSMKTLLMDHLHSAEPWPNIGVELNRRFVEQMLDEHMSRTRDHSQRLYMLLVLSIWARSLQGGAGFQPAAAPKEKEAG